MSHVLDLTDGLVWCLCTRRLTMCNYDYVFQGVPIVSIDSVVEAKKNVKNYGITILYIESKQTIIQRSVWMSLNTCDCELAVERI